MKNKYRSDMIIVDDLGEVMMGCTKLGDVVPND